jgi:hypothetical protein
MLDVAVIGEAVAEDDDLGEGGRCLGDKYWPNDQERDKEKNEARDHRDARFARTDRLSSS